jgi:hypothetical protein
MRAEKKRLFPNCYLVNMLSQLDHVNLHPEPMLVPYQNVAIMFSSVVFPLLKGCGDVTLTQANHPMKF